MGEPVSRPDSRKYCVSLCRVVVVIAMAGGGPGPTRAYPALRGPHATLPLILDNENQYILRFSPTW